MAVEARPRLKLTYEDYRCFPDDGNRHELIDGEHEVTPAPAPRHQWIADTIGYALRNAPEGSKLGLVLSSPPDVVLTETDVVQPDVLFLSRARMNRLTETCLRGAPDLVVEVLSESTRRRDEIVKRHLYERHGVQEYWVVDPVLETIKIYRRPDENDGTFAGKLELSTEAGDTLSTPLLPALNLPLANLFAWPPVS